MLGLPLTSGTPEIIEAIRSLQSLADIQKRRGDTMEQAWNEDHARVKRAEDPDNWRVVWNGDRATSDLDSTVLTHGNYVTLEGTGQALLYFRPCCQNLRCECLQKTAQGYCPCHKNDE
jgi:hypothetical protein